MTTRYRIEVVLEDSPVLYKRAFNDEKEARAFKKGFDKAHEIAETLQPYFCLVRKVVSK